MPSTERYTGTTSLEFILIPFKLFFTTYVVHVSTNLEMWPWSPTIFARITLRRSTTHTCWLGTSYLPDGLRESDA
jgi:hypothetical protein